MRRKRRKWSKAIFWN